MNKKNMTDMTTGSPAKHILLFAVPLLIGNLFQQFYNMVDSMVVGKFLGPDYLAAVGTCGSANFLFFSLSSGLSVGIGVIVAQYFGAGNERMVRATIANSFYVMVGAALLVSVIGYLVTPGLMRLLQVPEEIMDLSVTYMKTTCLGIVGIALYNGISAILRALGDSRTPLYFLIISCIVNVILDLAFVVVWDLGVFGVAFATIIAQAVSALTCLVYAYVKMPYFHFTLSELKPQQNIILKSIQLGVPIALQSSMIAVSCMALQGVVNSFQDTAVMSAYTITARIEQLVQQPYTSLSHAMTTYSGQNMGAGKVDRVRKGFRQAAIIVLVFSLMMLPVMFFGGEWIVGWFIKEDYPMVVSISAKALKITSLCYFGLGMIYVPRGILNGCGDTAFSMVNGITEVACRLIYAPILTHIPSLGFWGIWVTTGATWCTTGIVCVLRYFQGVWKHKGITEKK